MQKIDIIDINSLGKGVGVLDGKKLYISNSLPGEQIDIEDGKILNISNESKHRKEPRCKHFGLCGGCNLQHLSEGYYLDFKRNILKSATGFDELYQVPEYSRIRAEFKVSGRKIGFMQQATHNIIPIDECVILRPEILEIAKKIALLRNISIVHITSFANGLDLVVEGEGDITKDLTDFALSNHQVIRISHKKKHEIIPVLIKEKPVIEIGAMRLYPGYQGFLQPVMESSKKMVEFILRHIKGKKIIELYSGIGIFSLNIINSHPKISIDAYEGMKDQVSILNQAINNHQLNNLKAFQRDLVKNPLTAKELDKYEMVVVNPPRNGAGKQMEWVTQSAIKKLVMISCNPSSFERDRDILAKAGFLIKDAIGIDQFLYSNHLEIAAYFER